LHQDKYSLKSYFFITFDILSLVFSAFYKNLNEFFSIVAFLKVRKEQSFDNYFDGTRYKHVRAMCLLFCPNWSLYFIILSIISYWLLKWNSYVHQKHFWNISYKFFKSLWRKMKSWSFHAFSWQWNLPILQVLDWENKIKT